MPDKLTDNEIVKALKSWLEEIRKARQAYSIGVGEEHYPSMKYEYLLTDAIREINRLQADNIALNRRAMPSSGHIFKVGNALLFAENKEDYDITINAIKAEAYKEFVERLHEKLRMYGAKDKFNKAVFLNVVDKAKKELVGEDK